MIFSVVSERLTPFTLSQVLQMSYHDLSSYEIYTDVFKDWRRKKLVKNMGEFQNILFTLKYTELGGGNCLSATQAGFQHANNAVKEQIYSASVLENLVSRFFDKNVVAQLIVKTRVFPLVRSLLVKL